MPHFAQKRKMLTMWRSQPLRKYPSFLNLQIGGKSFKSLAGKHIHVFFALHFILAGCIWLQFPLMPLQPHLLLHLSRAHSTPTHPRPRSHPVLIQFTPSLSVCLHATYGGTCPALLPLLLPLFLGSAQNVDALLST